MSCSLQEMEYPAAGSVSKKKYKDSWYGKRKERPEISREKADVAQPRPWSIKSTAEIQSTTQLEGKRREIRSIKLCKGLMTIYLRFFYFVLFFLLFTSPDISSSR